MSDPAALIAAARLAAAGSYSPYSNFRVGAVVVAEDGTQFTGANVENAAFGSTICAEAVAIGHAVASGARKLDTVATACLDGDDCHPCGNCRQIMREFGVERVLVEGPDGEVIEHTLEELMPNSFGPESLGR